MSADINYEKNKGKGIEMLGEAREDTVLNKMIWESEIWALTQRRWESEAHIFLGNKNSR